MANLIQNNDQTIKSPVTLRGSPMDLSNVTGALYELFDKTRTTVLITKTLGSGITVIDSDIFINITETDIEDLTGKYYHELTIEDAVEGRSTVFKEFKNVDPTFSGAII